MSAPRKGTPAILMPNPFYPAYGAGARAADCETIYLPTTLDNGFLPDLDALDDATLARTVAIYHRLAGQPARCGGFARLFRPAETTSPTVSAS